MTQHTHGKDSIQHLPFSIHNLLIKVRTFTLTPKVKLSSILTENESFISKSIIKINPFRTSKEYLALGDESFIGMPQVIEHSY